MYIAIFYDQVNKLRQTPKAKSMRELHRNISLFQRRSRPSGGLVQVIETHQDSIKPLGRYVYDESRLCKVGG